MKPSTGTIVRVVLLVIALINMGLAVCGIVPEEIVGDFEAYEIGSYVVTAVMGLISAWKNNSFTQNALMADEYLATLRSGGKGKD